MTRGNASSDPQPPQAAPVVSASRSLNGCLYEAGFAPSIAAYARLGRALIEHYGKLVDSFRLSPGDVQILVRLRLAHAEDFFAMLKPYEWRYSSPTIFDGYGSLVVCYANAVDEMTGRMTDTAKIVASRIASTKEKA